MASVVLAFPPMKTEIILAAVTVPAPLVLPRGEAEFWRMMEVSASAPHAGVAQSRGVPSATSGVR